MGILSGKLSQDDIDTVSSIQNHSEFEDGFSNTNSEEDNILGGFDDLDSLFGESSGSGFDNDDTFGNSGNNGFPNTNNGFGDNSFGNTNNGFGDNSFGNTNNGFPNTNNGFPNTNNGFPNANNGFPNTNNGFPNANNVFGIPGQQQQAPQQDTMDKVIDGSVVAAENIGEILLEMCKSFKERNIDDIGYFNTNLMKLGVASIGIGIFAIIIGFVTSYSVIKSVATELILAGGLTGATGLGGIGIAALILTRRGETGGVTIDDIADEPYDDNDNVTETVEADSGSLADELFGDDFDDLFDDEDEEEQEPEIQSEPEIKEEEKEIITPVKIDYRQSLEDVHENTYIDRKTLVDTFTRMLPTNTLGFSDKTEMDRDSADFLELKTMCLKALSNIMNCSLSEVDSDVEKITETIFSYEILLKRVNKVRNVDDIANEIMHYFDDDDDTSSKKTCSAKISGDFYKITITKGSNPVVTFGDIFKNEKNKEYFYDTSHKLPIITGIDDVGKVILNDAKIFDTMLIAGKPRSGKSWYILSLLMALMLFNTPEDVQFILVDPKESNLFNTMALMPHVCGLHNDKKILDILDDIIEVEAKRRKKLLSDNKCDDIWALRKKGIKLPILYLVIDEYITVMNNLDKDDQKKFDTKIQVLISQLPSQGIRLIFVPHRATGVVNKTNRTMLQFTAAVKADTADVEDTLGIKKWTRSLTNPGDIALKTSALTNAIFVKGSALTQDDEQNDEFMLNAAKVFYKMGVSIPPNSGMQIAYNRDENEIREKLMGEQHIVQFNADNVKAELDNDNDDTENDYNEDSRDRFDFSNI